MPELKHFPDKSWGLENLNEYNEILKYIESYNGNILPLETENSGIFYALELVQFDRVKVLLIGQDPYPKATRAQGLSFSFRDEKKPADSLKNIFEKLNQSGYKTLSTDLTCWERQGVLLLNTGLTFTQKKDTAKWTKFWKPVIDYITYKLIKREKPLVIMLWGSYANLLEQFQDDTKDELLKQKGIYILRCSHPSNMGNAKNYSGNYKVLTKSIPSFAQFNPFEECNKFLVSQGETPINWDTK
ncbi:MAG: uracil-DNA glycosylase [Cyanobacteriota bacterium]|nr:uracil-DNA glycosylase [Cyanobacteriota bacterium]